jgi:hypothetical protein
MNVRHDRPSIWQIAADTDILARLVGHLNVDFPAWMVRDLDREAGRLGATRQSLIKM